jgi:ribosomal protein S18 acetylase RimI-like enzyme
MNVTIHTYADLSNDDARCVGKVFLTCTGEQFHAHDLKDTIFVVHRGDRIIGACLLSPMSPSRGFAGETEKSRIPYLYNFVCAPKYQRKGVGSLLMNTIKQYVATSNIYDMKVINLHTRVGDEKAISFFKKHKFERCGEFATSAGVVMFLKFTCQLS